ncbi:MAG: hypothetical protein RRY97_09295 [Oscillibacter sp.]
MFAIAAMGYVGIFVFCLAFAVMVPVFLVGVLLVIYMAPYLLWVGGKQQVGQYMDRKDEGFFTSLKHATQLYMAWILHRTPHA